MLPDAKLDSIAMTFANLDFNCSDWTWLNESIEQLYDEDNALRDLFGCSLLDMSDANSSQTPAESLPEVAELIPVAFQIAYRAFFTYFATVWCTFSILSNTATIIVLNHRSMKSTTNFLLTAVACSNLLIGALYLPFTVYFYIVREGEMNTLSLFMASALWLFVPTMLCVHMIQMWMTVAVTSFRLLFIRYAHRSQELCNTSRAKATLAGVTLGCVVLSIPCLVGHKVMLCVEAYPADKFGDVCGDPASNDTHSYYTLHIEKETDGQVAIFKSILLWINSVIAKFLPAVLLCGLSAMLVSTMKDADKRRHHLRLRSESKAGDSAIGSTRKSVSEPCDERDKKTNRTTRLLVVIAIMFIITYLPQSTLELIGSFTEVVRVEIGDKLGDVTDTLSLINSGMTFILYCFMSQQFRTVFTQVFIQPLTSRCGLKGSASLVSNRRASNLPTQKRQSVAAPSSFSVVRSEENTLAKSASASASASASVANNPQAQGKRLQVMILDEPQISNSKR